MERLWWLQMSFSPARGGGANSAPQIPLLVITGFEGPFRGGEKEGQRNGREGRGKEGEGREARENTPNPSPQ